MKSDAVKAVFDTRGYVGPLAALDESDNARYLQCMVDAEAEHNLMHSDYRCKTNVLFPWMDELTRNPRIGDAVEAVIGPDFHCWDTLFWIKYPETDKRVSWHQDATYWNFAPKHLAVTVWLCFSGATEEMGCIRYLGGSHRDGQYRHDDIQTRDNLLMRGQTIVHDNPLDISVPVEVPAGHFLMHHPHMIHGSLNNRSKRTRIACGMIFVFTQARPIATHAPESTIMIRGTDRYGYMQHDPRPTGDFARDRLAWRAAYDRQHENYYKMQAEA